MLQPNVFFCILSFAFSTLICELLIASMLYLSGLLITFMLEFLMLLIAQLLYSGVSDCPKSYHNRNSKYSKELKQVPKGFPWWFRCNCGGSMAGTRCRYLAISAIKA